jgi:hypothetical protein
VNVRANRDDALPPFNPTLAPCRLHSRRDIPGLIASTHANTVESVVDPVKQWISEPLWHVVDRPKDDAIGSMHPPEGKPGRRVQRVDADKDVDRARHSTAPQDVENKVLGPSYWLWDARVPGHPSFLKELAPFPSAED